GQRAPHKPLLVLYALGRWSHGDTGAIPFRDVDRDLTPMLREFGPPRQSYHPEYPFWRLQNDGVWAVTAAGAMKARQRNSSLPKGELLAHDALGKTWPLAWPPASTSATPGEWPYCSSAPCSPRPPNRDQLAPRRARRPWLRRLLLLPGGPGAPHRRPRRPAA